MKTLRLLLLALLIAGGVNAQYYQHTYGTPWTEVLESGVNTIAPNGKLMAGFSDFGMPGLSVVVVTRTDPAGGVGAPCTFNTGYFLIDVSGVQLNARARRVIELTTGNLAVWGDFTDIAGALSTRFFYMELTPCGGVVVIRSYTLPYMPFQVEATSMVQSTSAPGNVFVCGYSVNAAFSRTPVVLSLQTGTGNMNWCWEYRDMTNPGSDWIANDLEESPYPTASGVPDVAFVGRYANTPGGIGDGCFFTVSTATGLTTSPLSLYGTAADEQTLNGMTIAANPAPGGAGFVVCGGHFSGIFGPFSESSWVMKIGPNGPVQWSSLFEYSNLGFDDYSNDVIERVNMGGAFEYYAGGIVIGGGLFGANDAVVYKINAGGGPVGPVNQYTYGGPGNEDARQLGQTNVPAAIAGLSTFGNTAGSFPVAPGGPDFYLVKSYFNGVTACNVDRRRSPFFTGPLLYNNVVIDTNYRLKPDTIIHQPGNLNDVTICMAGAVGGGSNFRTGPDQLTTASISSLYPNPVSADNAIINLTFDEGGVSRDIEIELMNTLGQLCLQRKITIADGQTQLQLDLGSGLSKGIYHLVIREGDQVIDYKLSVQ